MSDYRQDRLINYITCLEDLLVNENSRSMEEITIMRGQFVKPEDLPGKIVVVPDVNC